MHGMVLDRKQVTGCLKKVLKSFIKNGYRCVSEHPILFTLGVLIYLLYRYLPGFFAFLLSSSPVIICTTLLLGILLSYGDTDLPEADEDYKTTAEISAFQAGNSSSDTHFETNQRFPVTELRQNTADFRERETKQTVFIRERNNEHAEVDDDVPLLRRVDQEYERFDRHDIPAALTPFPSMANFHQDAGLGKDSNTNQEIKSKDSLSIKDKANGHNSLFEGVLSDLNKKDASFDLFSISKNVNGHGEMEKKSNQARVFTDPTAGKTREIPEEKPSEWEAETSTAACAISVHQRKTLDELKINTSKVFEDNLLDSSLGSPWERVGSEDGSSGFDSDQAESSSPDASMTDIAPVLDEIDPLLGASSTHCDPNPKNDSDTDSHVSSHDHQTDDDSNGEDDNNDGKDNGDEKKKEDGKEAAFFWTADDEKNLMDLGYSELERNRRLELLMARRRSRKNIRFEIDNNLIDSDSNDGGRSVDDLSGFRVHIPHISVPRRNPFDLPYDSEEAAIPGSAPSVLHTRKNPFDLPLEQSSDGGVCAHDNVYAGESVTASHRDMFFRRHDSFNIGRTDAPQSRFYSRFKPYFVPETVDGTTGNFQRQFSDKSDCKLSSVTESDMTSSVADQEDHKDLDEKDMREHEYSVLRRQDSDLADIGSECSDGINSVDVELDNSDIDDREISLQHFVFERSQEREAYLSSTKGKGPEEDYLLKSAGSSTEPLHPMADLLSWEDGEGESSLSANFSHKLAVEFSDWVSSPRPTTEHDSGSGNLQEFLDSEVASSPNTILIGTRNPAENNGNVDLVSYSSNEILSDNLIHGSVGLPSEFCNEGLPVISRDLHPIPEERVVENFNVQEKHEAATFTDSTAVLTGFHVIEEHFDVRYEVSPCSTVVPSCTHADDSIQSPSVEIREISNPFISMAAESNKVDMDDVKDETAGFPLDSDDDADKIYPEPTEENVIDESFLSELDAVGDFRVEAMSLDQQVPDPCSHNDNTANGFTESSLISPQTSGNIFSTMKYASMLEDGESPLVDDLNVTGPEFGWSLRASHDDPEQTVYNPRRCILEASSFEEISTDMKPLCDETEVFLVNTPLTANLAVESSKLDIAENESVFTKTDTEMAVLDAKSLDDIEMDFKQASDGVVGSTVDTETSHASCVDIDSEPTECSAQLDVIEAKSVDDIYAALNEHSSAVVNNSLEEIENMHGETVKFTKHDKVLEGPHVEGTSIVDGTESEPVESTSNMDTIEAKTIDDLDAVFKKLSDGSAKSIVQAIELENSCEGREEIEQH